VRLEEKGKVTPAEANATSIADEDVDAKLTDMLLMVGDDDEAVAVLDNLR